MFLFGRRSGKGKPAKVKDSQTPAAAASGSVPGHDVAPRRNPSRRSTRRKRRSSRSTTSLRDAEKGPLDIVKPLHAPRRSTSIEEITALPSAKQLEHSPHLRPITIEHHIPYNFQPNAVSHSSIPRERRKLQRPQSLRSSIANDSSLLRRKSSRKRGHDSIREEEIRAMSMPLPQKRPAGNSQGMLRRESKKAKGGLNRHFERPTSNISLPVEDSIHSSMSGGSETRAWRVSALDMFSPRPKIRCSVSSPPYSTGTRTSPISLMERYEQEKEQEAAANRKHARRTSRIDDLADTLDAGALRQILERDKKRKEAKRRADDERLKRKLERRAERERLAEQRAAELAGAPSAPVRQTPAAVGLGIEEKVTSEPMEDIRPSTPPQPQPLETSAPDKKTQEVTQLPTPMDSPIDEPVVSDAKAVRYSRASMSSSPTGHTRGPSNVTNVSELPALLSEMISQEPLPEPRPSVQDPRVSGSIYPVTTTDTSATPKRSFSRRRSSETGRMAAFASLFRRGKRDSRDRGRLTPSEVSFSNTSRESMSRQPLPAHLVGTGPLPTQPIQIRRPSSVPRRTMSKFREDLPEYPMSPPDSRMQSPEITTSAIASRRCSRPPSDLRLATASPGAEAYRTDSPVSPSVPASGLMSQSLASVDSEGSWLSGKPMKRASNKSHIRSSAGSSTAAVRRNEEFNTSYEELGIPDDEYFRKMTSNERRGSVQSSDMMARKASSTAMAPMGPSPEIDEEILPTAETTSDEELVKHTVGRQPTVVHRRPRIKSAEGLLSFYQADKTTPEEDNVPTTPTDQVAEPDSPTSETSPVIIQRAKSVDLGRHHSRQLSAGSAKLLDIPAKRPSVDPKRSSLSSQQ